MTLMSEISPEDRSKLSEKGERPLGLLQNREIYPYSIEIPVRIRDIDIHRHINNSALADMYEEARAVFWKEIISDPSIKTKPTYVVASLQIHYLSEGYWGTPLIFNMGISYYGTRSWRERAVAYQGETCIAVLDVTAVLKPNEEVEAFTPFVRNNLEARKLTIIG